MKKDFSELEKEQLNAYVPIGLATKIRERAARRRWSLARTVSEALSVSLGIDPSEYGIEQEASH